MWECASGEPMSSHEWHEATKYANATEYAEADDGCDENVTNANAGGANVCKEPYAEPDDAADALAIAICASAQARTK